MRLPTKFDAKQMEREAREYVASLDMDRLILESGRPDGGRFIEGPPTMNGIPHAGHLRGRVIKDFWYRFSTLQGSRVEFNGGWDTQGLPVELQVEKGLGVTGGKSEAIRRFGVERIVAECKEAVMRYNAEWVRVDRMLGISLNHDRAYWTHHDGFIEREWQVLRRARESGILEEDFAVVAYCPSCQTSLSHAEVSQGYEEVRDPSLYYKARLADGDGSTYLIVWTTMPFTLVTDAMIGLHPTEEYARVRVAGQTWIVGRARLDEFMEEAGVTEYEVVGTCPGSEFEGARYVHPLLDLIPGLARCAEAGNYHVAVAEPFVDASTGSGLVHLSPANGEEDIRIANRRGVEVFSPIDDEARFTEGAGRYRGMFVRDADRPVVADLKERGALVHIGMLRHKYPLCWRSRHRIVWMARRGWFYKLDRLGDRAAEAAGGVEYFFEQPKNRFLGIIRERHPWCISRERVWGCPLPVWDCGGCGHKTWLFSREQITAAAVDLPDGPDFELHRPWIDNVRVRCGKCGGTDTRREEYVLDTWHNSGSAPHASLTDREYSRDIPAPFCTEGIDQTRGWAYTLLIENVILAGGPAPPYRAFLFQGHVLDEKGGKMSKSRGNVLTGSELLERYPADLVRLYFMWKASPIEPLSFSTDEMMSRPYQILSTLFNLHLYFGQNSAYDGFAGSAAADLPAEVRAGRLLLAPADVWLLSRLQGLIGRVTQKGAQCRFHEAARALEDFVINDLSQTYIPIVRGDLWDDGGGDGDGGDGGGDGGDGGGDNDGGRQRRTTIYTVLAEALRAVDIMIHPFCPFSSEYLYQATFETRLKSVLLERWPQRREALVDAGMEESFGIMTDVVSAAASARMKARLKRRWPLAEARICVNRGQKEMLQRLPPELLLSQLNVERCDIAEVDPQWWQAGGLEQVSQLRRMGLPAGPSLELDRKRVGPKAKRYAGELAAAFAAADMQEIFSSLVGSGRYDFEMGDGHTITLERDDFAVGLAADDGFAVSLREGACVVFIPASRDAEMVARGLVKDIARRLQALRKERGYSPTDTLEGASVLDLDAESARMAGPRAGELAFLVRARRATFGEPAPPGVEYKGDEIDGQKIRIAVW